MTKDESIFMRTILNSFRYSDWIIWLSFNEVMRNSSIYKAELSISSENDVLTEPVDKR